jgi:hypothetical protein
MAASGHAKPWPCCRHCWKHRPKRRSPAAKPCTGSGATPTDLDPRHRIARTIRGFRATCPLHRCIARFGERSGTTVEMLDAADRLRAAYDGSRIGFMGLRDWRPVSSLHYGPLSGPAKSALKQLRCRMMFERTWRLFEPATQLLLLIVVLRNQPIARFVEQTSVSYNRTKELLIAALDRLVAWFDIQPVRGAA